MAILSLPYPRSERLQRAASRPTLESVLAVSRVSRFDGRTRVLAIRTPDGWRRSRHLRWTRTTVDALRGEASEVLLSRGFSRARIPLSWVPEVHR